MIEGLLLAVSLLRDPCAEDARVLAEEAERFLAEGSDANHLAAARDLYRRARLAEPTPELLARGADLAVVAGDGEEAVRLLTDLARETPDLLGPGDRLLLADAAEARRRPTPRNRPLRTANASRRPEGTHRPRSGSASL